MLILIICRFEVEKPWSLHPHILLGKRSAPPVTKRQITIAYSDRPDLHLVRKGCQTFLVHDDRLIITQSLLNEVFLSMHEDQFCCLFHMREVFFRCQRPDTVSLSDEILEHVGDLSFCNRFVEAPFAFQKLRPFKPVVNHNIHVIRMRQHVLLADVESRGGVLFLLRIHQIQDSNSTRILRQSRILDALAVVV